jgi:hypothetical protein
MVFVLLGDFNKCFYLVNYFFERAVLFVCFVNLFFLTALGAEGAE